MGILGQVKHLGFAGAIALAMVFVVLPGPTAAQGIFDEDFFASDMIKAVRSGNPETLEAAILAGGNINDRFRGAPAIVIAAEEHDLSAIEMLAEAGARLDNRGREYRRTALTLAAGFGDTSIVRTLLEHGADPDRSGSGREAALIKAAHGGHANVLELLIEAGADLEATDLSGATALEIAEQERHRQATQVLRDAGAY